MVSAGNLLDRVIKHVVLILIRKIQNKINTVDIVGMRTLRRIIHEIIPPQI